MRKILPYILIVLTLVQLFAPLAFSNGIKVNKAEALDGVSITMTNIATTDTTANITIATFASPTVRASMSYDSYFVIVDINDVAGPAASPEQKVDVSPGKTNNFKLDNVTLTFNFSGLLASTPYNLIATIQGVKGGVPTVLATTTTTKSTLPAGHTDPISQGSSVPPTDDVSGMPTCSLDPINFHLGGCIAVALYWIFFKTTSFVFGLTGKVLDFTVMYSIQDTSYRSAFVVQGWGLVRDFCNMFFIFILLYIAFGTILNLHSVKTKEMIINVVIIGLLINFSLFATQVIIDASNILTRVFYNQKTIITGVKDPVTGVVKSELGDFGEIKLSEAIVSKVDPQKLVIQASKVNSIKTKGVDKETEETYKSNGEKISVGSFILVVFLATAVNVVGIIAFLSAGLIFIARVIGLWLAMILAPLAFFSYTVPSLQDMEMIGWKRWWPETLKLAFLAPIFAFFMYLIVGFMDKGLDVISASKTNGFLGLSFVVAMVVPFVFVMILLMKAKDIAKSMSGKIGQSITNGISAAGTAVIGGAAFGAAALGRGLISNPMKMMQSSQATRNAALNNFNVLKPSTYGKAISAKMANATIGKPKEIKNADGTTTTTDGSNKLRDILLKNKDTANQKAHATHLLDEQADKIQKGAKYSDLNAAEQERAREFTQKEEMSKFLFNKKPDQLDNFQNETLTKALLMDGAALKALALGLNKDISKFHNVEHLEHKYNERDPGIGATTLKSVAGGSYDVRNIKGEGLLAPVKGLMRTSLSGLGINVSKGQKDFMKDLQSTIKESMKIAKVEVKIDNGGHGGGNSHGGGHDDHGGGHH